MFEISAFKQLVGRKCGQDLSSFRIRAILFNLCEFDIGSFYGYLVIASPLQVSFWFYRFYC